MSSIKIPIETSARHIHLCREDFAEPPDRMAAGYPEHGDPFGELWGRSAVGGRSDPAADGVFASHIADGALHQPSFPEAGRGQRRDGR